MALPSHSEGSRPMELPIAGPPSPARQNQSLLKGAYGPFFVSLDAPGSRREFGLPAAPKPRRRRSLSRAALAALASAAAVAVLASLCRVYHVGAESSAVAARSLSEKTNGKGERGSTSSLCWTDEGAQGNPALAQPSQRASGDRQRPSSPPRKAKAKTHHIASNGIPLKKRLLQYTYSPPSPPSSVLEEREPSLQRSESSGSSSSFELPRAEAGPSQGEPLMQQDSAARALLSSPSESRSSDELPAAHVLSGLKGKPSFSSTPSLKVSPKPFPFVPIAPAVAPQALQPAGMIPVGQPMLLPGTSVVLLPVANLLVSNFPQPPHQVADCPPTSNRCEMPVKPPERPVWSPPVESFAVDRGECDSDGLSMQRRKRLAFLSTPLSKLLEEEADLVPATSAEPQEEQEAIPEDPEDFEHPFSRLPRIRGSPQQLQKLFSVQRACCFKGTLKAVSSQIFSMHAMLSQRELTASQAINLADLAERIVAHLAHFETHPIPGTPCRAVEVLGYRFVLLDMVVSALQVLGVQFGGWWEQLIGSIPGRYEMPISNARQTQLRRFNVQLLERLADAVDVLKKGMRPEKDELVSLKRALFCCTLSPMRFIQSSWNAWREDDKRARKILKHEDGASFCDPPKERP